MRRFMLCCLFAMTITGCGMMKGQDNRSVFATPERPIITSRDEESYRTTAKPRESFFRRVFLGKPREQ